MAGIQVLPRHQGRGLGSEVIGALAAQARASGKPLELGVEKDNPRARAHYARLGLLPVGEDGDETRMRLDP